MKRSFLFSLIVFFVLLLPTSCMSMRDTVSDLYYKKKFEMEIRKDDRFEELFYFERNAYLERTIASEFGYDIGIKFKDGGRIIFETRGSIYNIYRIIEIEDYKIYVSDLYFHGDRSEWSISYSEGINSNWIICMTNKYKRSNQFDNRLNKFLYHYDELKELAEKIDNEDPIPGLTSGLTRNEYPIPGGLINEERNIDINELGSKWGDDEELRKYTGYYNYTEHHRFNPGGHILKWKVYVEEAHGGDARVTDTRFKERR